MCPFLASAAPGSLLLKLASGQTTAFKLPGPKPFSFYLYIPSTHPVSQRARKEDTIGAAPNPLRFPLVVAVHGSRRDAEAVRDRWAPVAEEHQFVVLCPLFPAELCEDGANNYKKLIDASGSRTRYDTVLLEMLDYVGAQWGSIETDRVHLAGFSGGAQFAHRFWYLHSKRIASVCITSPGSFTALCDPLRWPAGIVNCEQELGQAVELEQLRGTPALLIVGGEDHGKGERSKLTRVATLKAMSQDWTRAGISYDMVVVPGLAHVEPPLMPVMEEFVIRQSSRQRAE